MGIMLIENKDETKCSIKRIPYDSGQNYKFVARKFQFNGLPNIQNNREGILFTFSWITYN